ncbi:MAG TPA: DUF1080 domain-containing protein, partial [Pirellulaceae bacterium]
MRTTLSALLIILIPLTVSRADDTSLPKACIDGNGPGWRSLGQDDFVNVNCDPDTWSFNNGQ